MTRNSASRRNRGSRYLDGAELKRRRIEAGLTQAALGEAISTDRSRIPQNRVAHWERGDDGCEINVICRLADALNAAHAARTAADEPAGAVPACTATDLMHEDGKARYRALTEAMTGHAA